MANLGRGVSLALTDEEKLDAAMPIPMPMPEYPAGCRICLCDAELDKLDVDEMPDKGDLIDMRIFARVMSVTDGVTGRRLELQIEEIFNFEDENTEDMDG